MKPTPLINTTRKELLASIRNEFILTPSKRLKTTDLINDGSVEDMTPEEVFQILSDGHDLFSGALEAFPFHFKLQSKLGAYISMSSAEGALIDRFEHALGDPKKIPAAIAVICPQKVNDNCQSVYFCNKFTGKGIVDVELTDETIFNFGRADFVDGKWWLVEAHAVVDNQGNARLLRQRFRTTTTIRSKCGSVRIPQSVWVKPKLVFGDARNEFSDCDILKWIINMHAHREYVMSVYAQKNSVIVGFPLPYQDAKTIFSDRNPVYEHGTKKRIFHWVASHKRHYQDGRVVPVKTHMRGLRNFCWNGFNIDIVLAGQHGLAYSDWNLAAFEVGSEADKNNKGKKIGMEDFLPAVTKRMGVTKMEKT